MAQIDIDDAIREHFPRLHRAALVLTGSPWDADDLAQETFLVVARSKDRFRGSSSLYTWLYGILLNLDRRERRRQGTHQRKLRVLWDDQPAEPKSAPPAEASVEVKEWKKSLWGHVAQLPDGQRQALVLRFSEGLRYEEIAEVLDCPLGTVKSRIFHGLLGLREMLGPGAEQLRDMPAHPTEDVGHAI